MKRKKTSNTCPYGDGGRRCFCHFCSLKKDKLVPYPLLLPIFVPIVFPILFIGVLLFFKPSEPELEVRYIRVNGQDCVIKHVKDFCTSTMACCGYDEAVCPENLSIP